MDHWPYAGWGSSQNVPSRFSHLLQVHNWKHNLWCTHISTAIVAIYFYSANSSSSKAADATFLATTYAAWEGCYVTAFHCLSFTVFFICLHSQVDPEVITEVHLTPPSRSVASAPRCTSGMLMLMCERVGKIGCQVCKPPLSNHRQFPDLSLHAVACHWSSMAHWSWSTTIVYVHSS